MIVVFSNKSSTMANSLFPDPTELLLTQVDCIILLS